MQIVITRTSQETPYPYTTPPSPPPAQYPINSRGDVRDGSGVCFGGHSEPMELSYQKAKKQNLCFTCSKPGHITAKCPDKKEVICMVIHRMSKEEHCNQAEEFMGLKKSEYTIEGEEDDEFDLEDFQDDLE